MFEREKLSSSNFNDWFRSPKTVLRVEKKLFVIEQPVPPTPPIDSKYFHSGMRFMMLIMRLLVLCSEELKSMFEKQARVERFDLIQTFHACKPEEGKSVSSYVLKMKRYLEQLKHLGYVLSQDLSTIGELQALLIEYEKSLPKKAATPQVMVIQGGRIQKSNKKSLNAKCKEHPTKDDACHHCKKVGHCKRNCPAYLAELIKKNKRVGTASSLAKHNLDPTFLWHCLAHIRKKRIKKLQQDRLLKSTDEESFDQCISCLMGKMTRKPFPHRTERVTDLLGIIHIDVCGPFRHVSRQDQGGEYISQEFKDYLKGCGIVQQLTPPYIPQQNKVFERRNHTLLDMVRSMINFTTLPLSFWDYALETAGNGYSQKDKNKAKTRQNRAWDWKECGKLKPKAHASESIDETSQSDAITTDLPITDSLVIEDEHLDTIPETDSDEEIESSVEKLNLTPSESKDLSDYEDVPVENFKIYSNPLLEFDEEIFSSEINSLYNKVLEDLDSIPPGNENDHFNAESNLIESFLNKDTVITSPKIDFLLKEFAGELALINLIPLGIAEPNFDPKEAIRIIKKLLYDNSSPRPPEELNSEISDAIIKYFFFPSPIPVEDNDSLMEEIVICLAPDDLIPPGIKNNDYDSEGDILFLEELLSNDSLSLPENESFHFDRYYVPSSPRPPEKPPDDDGIYFDIEPDMGVLTAFNHGILALKEEKYPHFLSHRGFKTFQIIYDFSESPMMIYGGDMSILDVHYLHLYPP
ncbi:retrotransposon protein, putative, ty1-copia subclass [Tanacetum coccineum]